MNGHVTSLRLADADWRRLKRIASRLAYPDLGSFIRAAVNRELDRAGEPVLHPPQPPQRPIGSRDRWREPRVRYENQDVSPAVIEARLAAAEQAIRTGGLHGVG